MSKETDDTPEAAVDLDIALIFDNFSIFYIYIYVYIKKFILKIKIRRFNEAEEMNISNERVEEIINELSSMTSDINEKTKTLNLYNKAMEWLSNRECHTVEPDLLVPKDLYSSLFPFQKLSLEWFYNVHRTNVGK